MEAEASPKGEGGSYLYRRAPDGNSSGLKKPENPASTTSYQRSDHLSPLEDRWGRHWQILSPFINIFLFLASVALIAAALQVSVAAMPLIAASLTLTLGLTAAPWLVTLIAALPLIASCSLGYALFINPLLLRYRLTKYWGWEPKISPQAINALDTSYAALVFTTLTGIDLEIAGYEFKGFVADIFDRRTMGARALTVLRLCAIGAALGLGIFLAIQLLPLLMAVLASLHIPFGVSILAAALTLLTLFAILYQTFALPLKLLTLFTFLRQLPIQQCWTPLARRAWIVANIIGLGLSIPTCYLFFPLLVNILIPILGPGLATFTAIAVSVSFTWLMMNLANQLASFFFFDLVNFRKGIGQSGTTPYHKIYELEPQTNPLSPSTLRAEQKQVAEQQWDTLLKITLIGEGKVGKTALREKFTKNHFSSHYSPTIGIDFSTKIMADNKKKRVKLQLWETVGYEQSRGSHAASYRGSHGIIIAYDITDKKSFDQLSTHLEEVKRHVPENCHLMLLGCKSDLEDQREVSTEGAQEFAESQGMLFMETSAKTGENVEQAFLEFTQHIMKIEQNKKLAHTYSLS